MHPIIRKGFILGTGIVASLAATSVLAATGAIYDTDVTSTPVNENQYSDKNNVYLNGGPQNNNAKGLPSGRYYFRVTDPSQGTLLSSDPLACRQATVGSNGRFAGSVPAGGCEHPNGNPNTANGSVGVKLMPFDDTTNPGGEYKAEIVNADCADAAMAADSSVDAFNTHCEKKTDNFKVLAEEPPICTTCGTGQDKVTIGGTKFYDVYQLGVLEDGDGPIAGFRIDIYENGSTTPLTLFTDEAGFWTYQINKNALYRVCEVAPTTPVWTQTYPADATTTSGGSEALGGCWDGFAVVNDLELDFGNTCFTSGGGLTLGFWSNKNGQALVGTDDIAMLNGLNLRNASGTDYVATTAKANSTWLLSANATNMAFMLSAQLAAMALNVHNGKVSASAMIYAPGTIAGNANFGFATVQSIMDEANASLGANALTVSASVARTYQEALKNALDNANNNRNFKCSVTY